MTFVLNNRKLLSRHFSLGKKMTGHLLIVKPESEKNHSLSHSRMNIYHLKSLDVSMTVK